MKNYVIRCKRSHRDQVLELIRDFSNDIEIDSIKSNEIGITIEREDEESDEMLRKLKEEIANHHLVLK